MSDLKKYVENRKKKDKAFAEGYDHGFEEFKIGFMLKEAREKSGLTQEELARKIKTTKSAISRIENHSEDIKLSTLIKVANSLGRQLSVKIL
ncbi:MAG TPA: helix-turn-helix transcriptional regulator [Spirochaetota bacterium]|jgi:DNA-binding XRE family transcriptional regulator|nr:helix-turn-helix transcriptional regulator [Spirochaetota bacterium]HPJ13950.1 helix-turn-helix transcriptional regulator [Spirochaetota bacterium]HPM33046.1 helix-turn-helix transcriptional regulator [Spirochaetota bacterium]